jgi:hypothetical protein
VLGVRVALQCSAANRDGTGGDNRNEDAWLHSDNNKVEQLAANWLTIPQDAIASLLQRLVLPLLLATAK